MIDSAVGPLAIRDTQLSEALNAAGPLDWRLHGEGHDREGAERVLLHIQVCPWKSPLIR